MSNLATPIAAKPSGPWINRQLNRQLGLETRAPTTFNWSAVQLQLVSGYCVVQPSQCFSAARNICRCWRRASRASFLRSFHPAPPISHPKTMSISRATLYLQWTQTRDPSGHATQHWYSMLSPFDKDGPDVCDYDYEYTIAELGLCAKQYYQETDLGKLAMLRCAAFLSGTRQPWWRVRRTAEASQLA